MYNSSSPCSKSVKKEKIVKNYSGYAAGESCLHGGSSSSGFSDHHKNGDYSHITLEANLFGSKMKFDSVFSQDLVTETDFNIKPSQSLVHDSSPCTPVKNVVPGSALCTPTKLVVPNTPEHIYSTPDCYKTDRARVNNSFLYHPICGWVPKWQMDLYKILIPIAFQEEECS